MSLNKSIDIWKRFFYAFREIVKRIVYYELLPETRTINLKKYFSQLSELMLEINKKHQLASKANTVFHQNVSRHHFVWATRQKILHLCSDVLTHTYSSLDPVPLSQYHTFKYLQNSLNGKNFTSLENFKNPLDRFFDRKLQIF